MARIINQPVKKFKAPNQIELERIINDVYEHNEYSPLKKLGQGKILDLGTHVGVASRFLSELFTNYTIIALEPNQTTYKYLQENLKDIYYQVCTLNAAITISDKDNHLYLPSSKSRKYGWYQGNSLIKQFLKDDQNVIPARIFTLDYRYLFMQPIALCKMDIEGYEFKLLNELFRTGLINNAAYYMIEFHGTVHNTQKQLDQILENFKKIGYKIKLNGKDCQFLKYEVGEPKVCHIFKY